MVADYNYYLKKGKRRIYSQNSTEISYTLPIYESHVNRAYVDKPCLVSNEITHFPY